MLELSHKIGETYLYGVKLFKNASFGVKTPRLYSVGGEGGMIKLYDIYPVYRSGDYSSRAGGRVDVAGGNLMHRGSKGGKYQTRRNCT